MGHEKHSLEAVGLRLKEERLRIGVSQTELADSAGVTRRSQGNYESGERSPDADYLMYAAQLGVDVGYVITGERTKVGSSGGDLDAGELLRYWRKASADTKAVVMRVLKSG